MRLFARSTRTLKWATPAIALAWVGWLGWFDQRAFEPGPVSTAHALFGHECGRCHVGSGPESFSTLAAGVAFSAVPDKACVVCHDGLAHHAPLQSGEGAKCVDCHREHRDRRPLARVADGQCTVCHADLNRTSRAEHNFARAIDSWAEHPEFAVLRPSSGSEAPGPGHGVRRVAKQNEGGWIDGAQLKFNHAVHLDARGVLQLDGSRKRLECSACHVPDRSTGYMLPIDHDQHCASCHGNQLLFDATLFPGQRVPHAYAVQVRGALRELYATHLANKTSNLTAQSPPPDKPVLPTMRVSREDAAWTDARIDDANRTLFEQKGTGCRYCHTDVELLDGQWHVAFAAIPQRWLRQGVFRHDSHRMLACTACHQGVEQSRETTDILLPSIANCRSCHQQPGAFQLTGAARAECAECHAYHQHGGDHYDGPLDTQLKVVRPDQVARPPATD